MIERTYPWIQILHTMYVDIDNPPSFIERRAWHGEPSLVRHPTLSPRVSAIIVRSVGVACIQCRGAVMVEGSMYTMQGGGNGGG